MKKYFEIIVLTITVLVLTNCTNTAKTKLNYKSIEPKENRINIVNRDEIVKNKYIIGTEIKLVFDSVMDGYSFRTENIKLLRVDNGEEIEIELQYRDKVLTIHLLEKFEIDKNKVLFKGIKPATKYKLVIDTDKILSENKLKLNELYSEINFESEELNYGIYWFGRDGYCQKYVEGVENRYFNPENDVVLHSHGWQIEKTTHDYFIDQPYYVKNRFYENIVVNDWLDEGYNLGAWIWGQFADELTVYDAEEKIWSANGRKKMRYKLANRKYKDYDTKKSIHELLYDDYLKALKDYEGNEIRFTGHSLGNQVITALAGKLEQEIDKGTVNEKLLPKRLTLLDPFWSNFPKSYLDGMWTGEKCQKIVESLITTKGVVVEEVKSSEAGNTLSGDNNSEMRKYTSLVRVWLAKIPILDFPSRHNYASDWYFRSIGNDIIVDGYKLGAKATTEELRNSMNYFKAIDGYWLQYKGFSTIKASDDEFITIPGVVTF